MFVPVLNRQLPERRLRPLPDRLTDQTTASPKLNPRNAQDSNATSEEAAHHPERIPEPP
jgi:hypothetical protein